MPGQGPGPSDRPFTACFNRSSPVAPVRSCTRYRGSPPGGP